MKTTGKGIAGRATVVALVATAVAIILSASSAPSVSAQGYRLRGVTPIFDGWETLKDGSRVFYFGYINRNATEAVIPIGPANSFDGTADRGQPTVFQTGRQEHVFTIKQPANYNGKMVWTINSEMGTQVATGSANQLYILEVRENASPDAKPPEVKVSDLTAKVGESLALAPTITPAVSGGQVVVEAAAAEASGLNVSWSKYRGPGAVTFTAAPAAPGARGAAAGRGRGGAASATSAPGTLTVPCGARANPACGAATVRFDAPGAYMLRVAARQDGMDGIGFVRVTVNP